MVKDRADYFFRSMKNGLLIQILLYSPFQPFWEKKQVIALLLLIGYSIWLT